MAQQCIRTYNARHYLSQKTQQCLSQQIYEQKEKSTSHTGECNN